VVERGDKVTVSVTDPGPGIPPEEQKQLFAPFGRTSIEPAHGEKSVGLGLAICRRIIEGHRGQIGVDSTPGHGSVFWFALPLENPRQG
jgi:signal transduction histidine kinase